MLINLHPELVNIVVIDGSLINATHSMHWADYRNGSKKVKIHVVFDLNHEIQSKILFTDGKGAGRPFVRLIITLARKKYLPRHAGLDPASSLFLDSAKASLRARLSPE